MKKTILSMGKTNIQNQTQPWGGCGIEN
jgi:hypothetical protein